MNINPISPSNLVNILSHSDAVAFDSNKIQDFGESSESFANVLSEAFNTVSQTDAADKASGIELMMGQSDDLSGLLLDAQKAELSLNLALQIRNKVVDAYNEMMRMQV